MENIEEITAGFAAGLLTHKSDCGSLSLPTTPTSFPYSLPDLHSAFFITTENMAEKKDETTFECEVEKLAALVEHSELTDSGAGASTSAAGPQTLKPINGEGQAAQKENKKRNWRWNRRERKAQAGNTKKYHDPKESGRTKTPYGRGKRRNTTPDGPERALRVVLDALLDRFK
ncbi:uncharacterized protein LOC107270356 [Cephus cinctus]|uniref:Uncharacterized protein LOC107270356 n=1 Tax=Cephus cinctus TaxID=211228 RepID=A0AAJ7C329_CEPCN|nr:uncharacterized protein LOC107270356 [Cephus cinctus]